MSAVGKDDDGSGGGGEGEGDEDEDEGTGLGLGCRGGREGTFCVGGGVGVASSGMETLLLTFPFNFGGSFVSSARRAGGACDWVLKLGEERSEGTPREPSSEAYLEIG
jgi:hypothetical protein